MPRPKAEREPDDALPDVDDLDPASGARVKRKPSEVAQLLVAEFKRRATGLSGDELDREVERLLDRMIEKQAGVVPAAMRAEVKETLRSKLVSDPTMGAMLEDLRAAARRG